MARDVTARGSSANFPRDPARWRLPLTPEQLAARARALLREAGDPRVARQARTYFKEHEKVRFHGVASPRLRQIERDLFRSLGGRWSAREAAAFCDLVLRSPYSEEKNLGILLLGRFRKGFEKDLLRQIEAWLREDRCDNWSATDAMCGWVLAPLLRRYPDLIGRLPTWGGSRNLWLRRASLAGLVPLARKGEHLDAAYRAAGALLGDREDLIHKATGWLLREAGKTDAKRLEVFLLQHGPEVPRTALRYAIERFPRRRRRAILSATRPPLPPRPIRPRGGSA